jgi:hypothetical protein
MSHNFIGPGGLCTNCGVLPPAVGACQYPQGKPELLLLGFSHFISTIIIHHTVLRRMFHKIPIIDR